MVLGVESRDGSGGDSDEVVNVLSVGEVLVEVVLEVLNKVHVLLDEVISSNSLEGESLVEELIGVHSNLWVLTLLLELGVDLHSVVIVSPVESSRELLELESELSLGLWEWGNATIEEDLVVHNLVWGSGGSWCGLKLNSRSDTQEGHNGVFHMTKTKGEGKRPLNLLTNI